MSTIHRKVLAAGAFLLSGCFVTPAFGVEDAAAPTFPPGACIDAGCDVEPQPDAARPDSPMNANEGGGGAEDLPGTTTVAGGAGDTWRPTTEIILPCSHLPQVAAAGGWGDWDHTRCCGPAALIDATSCMARITPTYAMLESLDTWLDVNRTGYDSLPGGDCDFTNVDDLEAATIENLGYGAAGTTDLTLEDIYHELEAARPVAVVVETQGGNNPPSDEMRRGLPHWMEIIGMGPRHVIFNDPGRSAWAGAARRYTISSFLNLWANHARTALTFGTPSCADACTLSATRCADATTLERCVVGADSCAEWTPATSCDACASGTCCSHACSYIGASRCHASGESTCMLEATGCRAWSSPRSCVLSCDGDRCASGECASGATRGCPGGGTQTCDASRRWGACIVPDVCNGLDDDGNGIVDDRADCWVTVYRFASYGRGYTIEARCLGTSTTPSPECAIGFTLEREALLLATAPGPGRVELVQCSSPPLADGFRADHIVVPAGSADHLVLRATYACRSLGWAWPVGAGPAPSATPFGSASRCALWRYRYDARPGLGAHLFSAQPEISPGLCAELPARADVLVPSGGCFPGTPSAC